MITTKILETYVSNYNNPPPEHTRPSYQRKLKKEMISIRNLSRRERLLNLLNILYDDLLVTEMAENATYPTRIISIAGGRFNPMLAEGKLIIKQMIENVEQELDNDLTEAGVK